ncbi:meprin 1 alpha, isoform CRA_a [Mus musculus]|nr:meprin 1 alpha, isoform CRA_a [Mus musculus]
MARRLGRSSSFAIMLWIQPACLLSLIFSAHIAAVSIKHLLNGSDHDTDVGEQKDIFEINLAAGLNLFQGDILLPRTRNAMRDPSSRWKLPIPYILADNLELNAKGAILHAFEMFRLKSCVDFKPYEGEKIFLKATASSFSWTLKTSPT